MEWVQKIKEIAESGLSQDQFIVDVLFSGKKIPARLLVIVDGDRGVTIDQCAGLSRYLSEQLDSSNLIGDAYTLEVSTPGLDQPLKLKRQYFKNKGRQVKLHLVDKSIVQGKLAEVSEELVRVEMIGEGKKKEIKVKEVFFPEIEKGFVLVSFK